MRRRPKLTGDHLEAFDAAIVCAALASEVASESHEQSAGVTDEQRNRLPRAEI